MMMQRRNEEIVDKSQNGMDLSFIVLLVAISISGLLLLGVASKRRDGKPAAYPLVFRHDALPHDALWSICPWNLSVRCAAEVVARAVAPAKGESLELPANHTQDKERNPVFWISLFASGLSVGFEQFLD
jgi:hypothetical protein